MSINRVWFDDPRGQRRYVDSERALVDIRQEGLFLDLDWELAFEWVNWVPPSRIVCVTKLPDSASGDGQ